MQIKPRVNTDSIKCTLKELFIESVLSNFEKGNGNIQTFQCFAFAAKSLRTLPTTKEIACVFLTSPSWPVGVGVACGGG